MALIVETGEGLPAADSYISLQDADTYFTAYPNDAWAGEDLAKEVALRRATQELDLVYGGQFVGTPKSDTQALAFPRTGDDIVPVRVERATCELAALILGDPSFSATSPSDDAGITEKTLKLGKMEKSVKFDSGQAFNKLLSKVQLMLGPLLQVSSSGFRQADVVRG